MKRTVVLLTLLTALVCGGLSLASCKQSEGKLCSSLADCDDDLICCFDGVAANDPLGVCLPEAECMPLDGGVSQDASATQDASP
jgi:hypothetical protein